MVCDPPMIGQQFRCVCCKEPHDEQEATYEDDLGGPVCDDCRKALLGASAWLKTAGMKRVFKATDITQSNHARFKNYTI